MLLLCVFALPAFSDEPPLPRPEAASDPWAAPESGAAPANAPSASDPWAADAPAASESWAAPESAAGTGAVPVRRFSAPPEGAWIRGPALLRISPGEEDGESIPFMLIRTETVSGKRAIRMGGASLELGGEWDEITHVRVEAYIEDKEGNR
ncbi:MAG: hypothetical protein LBH73_05610, partial [Spirochaetaceae bacterium]|nr:hypothetical protein [Spirochaetaceae bacterium]